MIMRSIAASLACVWVFGGIFAGVGGASAQVTTLSTFQIGNWQGGAYSGNNTNGFDHCAGAASYQNGSIMIFEVGSKFQWSMGFSNPSWTLTVGQSYPVSFSVDGNAPSMATAMAITANQVQVQLAANNPLFQLFRYGETLRVQTASQTMSFALTNTIELLPALLNCAERYTGTTATPVSNPFAPN
jgi:hypothetical protein